MKRFAAALTLFTRFPAWKLGEIPEKCYSSAVVFWPLTGWLTGGLMALIIWSFSLLLPLSISVVLAIIARLLLTGALHEDGLADFCDAFGARRDKDSTLRIMKDSSTGAYGVIGLVVYFLLLWNLLSVLPSPIAALAILAADPFGKGMAAQITNLLPYSRPEGAKNRIAYERMGGGQFFFNIVTALIPMVPLIVLMPLTAVAIVLPCAGLIFMCGLMKKRIGGYTGDCCGATFLICEILMLLGIVIIFCI